VQILDFLVLHKFNALRIPFSLTFALSPANTTCPDWSIPWQLKETSAWDLLDELFAKAVGG
jgi:hypothetical protein